jgi:hypothetical protein
MIENLPDLSQDENFMDDVAENIENEKAEYADETFEAPD